MANQNPSSQKGIPDNLNIPSGDRSMHQTNAPMREGWDIGQTFQGSQARTGQPTMRPMVPATPDIAGQDGK